MVTVLLECQGQTLSINKHLNLVTVSVTLQRFSDMDIGDLSTVTFSTLDEDTEYEDHDLYQKLLVTQTKLRYAQQAQESLAKQFQNVEKTRQRLGLGSRIVANHPIAMRLSAFSTMHHMMWRYELILQRDMMLMKKLLGMNVRPHARETWYNDTEDEKLRREAPNVHSLFLLSLDLQDTDIARTTLWRPTD